MTPAAHVFITTYERASALHLTLRGYLRQTAKAFAITVADDGSGPETRSVVEACAAEARARGITLDHVWQEDRGFRKSRVVNEAVRGTNGEALLIFTDGDCIPPAHFVERHLDAHETRALAVGGVVLLSQAVSEGLTAADVDAGRHESLATPVDRRDLRRRARKSRWGMLLRRKNRPKIFGANVAVARELFLAINGFDEGFPDYGFEDTDLRDRLMRLRPRPTVRILHGTNDVFHLWHARPEGRREASRMYYETARPVRCEHGLEPASPKDGRPPRL